MGDSNSSDVDRALAAFGATPIKYRSFGKHQLRPDAAYVAAPATLDDTVYDPFAPQPLMHPMDEAQPDVLLPVSLPAVKEPMAEPAIMDETTWAHLPTREDFTPGPPVEEPPRPAPVRYREPIVEDVKATPAAPPDAVQVEPVTAVPAPTAITPPVTAALPTVPPLPAPSLPTLGTQFVTREGTGARGLDGDATPRSLSDMFRLLNGRPTSRVPCPSPHDRKASTCSAGCDNDAVGH